ncbi:MAG TPA: PKD domain-containing protein [Vicinamibacterales bacterium]|nr:PKD domain-containing protein [Vicinamibacterales bacterium]
MLSRFRGATLALIALSGFGFIASSCQKVPLLAPSGSTITLTASTTALPVGGTTQILAQVIEPSGTPPHAGTQITFTTNLGSLQPSSVETDINGQATTTFSSGGANGTATITAISGGVSASGNSAIKIAVGTAAVGRVALTAAPTIVPANGGTTTLTASVFDINGNPLVSAPVSFATTAGTLDQFVVTTDKNGNAVTKLTTANQATVTATVGATGSTAGGGGGSSGGGSTTPTTPTPTSTQTSAQVTINVAGAPTLVITPPTTTPSAGLPASYTFAVTASTTNGTTIRDLTVNWGDGTIQDLGAVTGNAVVSHTYRSAGVYTITGTVVDNNGFSVPISTAVTVNATSIPVTLTPPTTAPGNGLPATFTVAPGTLPQGDAIKNVHIDWGDGTAQDLGSITGSTSISHVFTTAGTYNVSATITDTVGNTSGVSTSVTVVATANPTVNITPTNVPTTHSAVMPVTFQLQVTAPTGVNITDATIDFGDGTTSDLGGVNGTVTVQHSYTSAGAKTVTVNAKDTLNRTTTGTTTVVLP